MQEIKYVKVEAREILPVVWAYTNSDALERDLRITYANGFKVVARSVIDESLARKTQSFNSEYFRTWIEQDQGRVMAFNLGTLVEKE